MYCAAIFSRTCSGDVAPLSIEIARFCRNIHRQRQRRDGNGICRTMVATAPAYQ